MAKQDTWLEIIRANACMEHVTIEVLVGKHPKAAELEKAISKAVVRVLGDDEAKGSRHGR